MTTEKDSAMGISKMPLRRYWEKEGKIFEDKDSDEEENLEKEMQQAFEMLSQADAER